MFYSDYYLVMFSVINYKNKIKGSFSSVNFIYFSIISLIFLYCALDSLFNALVILLLKSVVFYLAKMIGLCIG